MRGHEDPNYGTVDYFADLIRESASRTKFVDAATTGLLRAIGSGPGTDEQVRTWFRNALDAGDLVRAELPTVARPQRAEPFYPDDDCSDDESAGGDPRSGCAITPTCTLRCHIRHQEGEAQLNDAIVDNRTDPFVQYGHNGQHHGRGTPDCPRELHHHHDERCEPPTVTAPKPTVVQDGVTFADGSTMPVLLPARPRLGPDDHGDCESCDHLVVSHQDDGCHAELRTPSGSRPCPCQLARWQVTSDTGSNAGGAS